MKFINKMLCITLLFAIGSSNTKGRKPAAKRQPASQAKAAQQVSSKKYQQLRANVLRMNNGNVIDPVTNSFKDSFVNSMKQQIVASDLGAQALSFLLQTARDKFIPLTGNDNEDLITLKNINTQIEDATSDL